MSDTPLTPDAWLACGRTVAVAPHRWFVREAGTGPVMLLLHGVGASSHSFAWVAPALARRYRLIAVDLPGQGRSRCGARGRLGPRPLAEDLLRLLDGTAPAVVVGHSAGAAVAVEVALRTQPQAVVTLAGAFEAFGGAAAWLYTGMAGLLSLNPFAGSLIAQGARQADAMVQATGARLGPEAMAQYRALMADRRHVEGAIAMMAAWSLAGLVDRAALIPAPVLCLSGARDTAVPPEVAERFVRHLQRGSAVTVPDAGHLLHEEAPEVVSGAILDFLDRSGAAAGDHSSPSAG